MLSKLMVELNYHIQQHDSSMWFCLVFDNIRDPEFPIKLFLCQHDHNQGPNGITQTVFGKFASDVAAVIGLNEETVRWSLAERDDDADD